MLNDLCTMQNGHCCRMQENQGLGCSFLLPPSPGVQACQESNRKEREKRGGRNVPLDFSLMVFVRGEGTSVFVKGPGRRHSKSRMQPSGPGYPGTQALTQASGKIKPVLQILRLQLRNTCLCSLWFIASGFPILSSSQNHPGWKRLQSSSSPT